MTILRVTLHPPRIDGDTVWFTWDDDTGLPDPPEGGLFYRYEGIDLSQFSDELWLEIFLALRLRTYARLQQPVALQLPFAVPQPVIDFWRTYHNAGNVTVSPVAEVSTYSPWSADRPATRAGYDAAVFFGGGRDSLSTACLLGEIYRREKVLLIQCVDPHSQGAKRRQEVTSRFEHLSLGPAHDVLGFATQRIWTNLHAVALGEGGKSNEPHIEQYTAGQLPVLLTHNIPLSSIGYTWGDYTITENKQGKLFHYATSRPEMLEALHRHYQRTAGIDHRPININLALNGGISFRLLAHRYPDAFPHIMSCQPINPGNRWCHHCVKCGRFAVSCLQEGVRPVDFNLDRFFAISKWMRGLIESVREMEAPPPGENAPWRPGWCGPGAFMSYCQAFHHADLDFVQSQLGPTAWCNYLVAAAMYGNRDLPINELSPAEAYEWLPADLAGALKPIISSVATVEPLGDRRIETGDGTPVLGPFAVPFHHPLLDLPLLQDRML